MKQEFIDPYKSIDLSIRQSIGQSSPSSIINDTLRKNSMLSSQTAIRPIEVSVKRRKSKDGLKFSTLNEKEVRDDLA